MEQFLNEISVNTKGEGFIDITSNINNWIKEKNIIQGILVISTKHTSCSLIINENADPRVLEDLSNYMKSIVPERSFKPINGKGDIQEYLHSEEGVDDMPAHIRTTLTSTNLSLSINNSRLDLGTWQAIYLWEHRYSRNIRKINLHSICEAEKTINSCSKDNLSSVMVKTNASKLNKIVMSNQNQTESFQNDSLNTNLDLLVDRIHDIASLQEELE
ncbi:secondary thiamine-phosphate synthase enzyme YjbQ [Prochlorococcus marinus]|uniref:secondary thiamine-phosphate synthase enzyme YjbQ n=1 Tax=Prochlorococcus marinus TaxID=1219 RepID=UPI0022B5283A|nr:secondary thiamine-phosphate synthase enzyme YjbQ [Prochlorococcus marinus]